jgi:hypothetical protein
MLAVVVVVRAVQENPQEVLANQEMAVRVEPVTLPDLLYSTQAAAVVAVMLHNHRLALAV